MKTRLFVLAAFAAVCSFAQTRTTVTDTLYKSNGTYFTGTLKISNPTFERADGQVVFADTLTVVVGASGVFTVDLEPTSTATPVFQYRVEYELRPGTKITEYWTVPVSVSDLGLSDVRDTWASTPANQAIPLAALSGTGASDGYYVRWNATTSQAEWTATLATIPVGSITGLGSGVATWLASPTAANLIAATDLDARYLGISATAANSSLLEGHAASYFAVAGASMVYPGAGIPNSTGSAWGTSYTVGTSANNIPQLDGSGLLASSIIPDLSAAYSPLVGSPSLVTLGTITTGVWNGTAIGTSYLTPPGSDGQLLVNDGGAFGSLSGFTYDGTDFSLSSGKLKIGSGSWLGAQFEVIALSDVQPYSIWGTTTATSGSQIWNVVRTDVTPTGSSTLFNGNRIYSKYDSSQTNTGAVIGLIGGASVYGGGSVSSLIGVYGGITVNSGSATNAYAFYDPGPSQAGGSGTITNYIQFAAGNIDSSTFAENRYGFYQYGSTTKNVFEGLTTVSKPLSYACIATGSLVVSDSGTMKIGCDSTLSKPVMSMSGAAYVPLATISGSVTDGHCAEFDASGNIVDAGAACGTGGSGDTVAAGTGIVITGSSPKTIAYDSAVLPGKATDNTFSGAQTFTGVLTVSGASAETDDTGALKTKPVKTGTSVPTSCEEGELFFKTDASDGGQMYTCDSDGNGMTAVSGGSAPARNYGCAVGDPAGSELSTGVLCYLPIPDACTITAWDIVVDAGTATVDVWKVATGTAIPTNSDTITAGAEPAIASGTAIHSTTLTGWTTSVSANDIIGFNLDAESGVKYISATVQCQ